MVYPNGFSPFCSNVAAMFALGIVEKFISYCSYEQDTEGIADNIGIAKSLQQDIDL